MTQWNGSPLSRRSDDDDDDDVFFCHHLLWTCSDFTMSLYLKNTLPQELGQHHAMLDCSWPVANINACIKRSIKNLRKKNVKYVKYILLFSETVFTHCQQLLSVCTRKPQHCTLSHSKNIIYAFSHHLTIGSKNLPVFMADDKCNW